MSLAEVPVDWVDAAPAADAAPRAVFVRCKRVVDDHTKPSSLRLELLCGPRMWRCEVRETHKPSVLDCSASEYLRALETAFSGGGDRPRFTCKWSESKAALTLMERAASGFAMKYTALAFDAVDDEASQLTHWQELFHDVVEKTNRSESDGKRQEKRIQELESVVTAKDKLLETALSAKQKLEDELFRKFCAVLNAKKEEIQRLQSELATARVKSSSATAYKGKAPASATGKKRAAPTGRKKPVGAKLTKRGKAKTEETSSEEEEDADADDDEDENDSSAAEGDDGEKEEEEGSPMRRARTRVKREAINAYSQLASQLHIPSQVCAAADVLDDLDDIMKTEVEQDEEQTQAAGRGSSARKRPAPPTVKKPTSPEKKTKLKNVEAPPASKKKETPKAKPPPKLASPPRKPVDSEEEDILDMLS